MHDALSDSVAAAAQEAVAAMSSSHRKFALALLRAIERVGGAGRKKVVIEELRSVLAEHLTPEEFDELNRNNRFGWVRFGLRDAGLLAGAPGTWALTDAGRRYLASQAHVVIEIPAQAPGRKRAVTRGATETVPVTGFRGYDIPVLETLAAGKARRREIVEEVGRRLVSELLPGDRAKMPSGQVVWEFRTHFVLSMLSQDGSIESVQRGVWRITASGLQRLEAERATWKLSDEQGDSMATVLAEGAAPPETPPEASPELSVAERFKALRKVVPASLLDVLIARLRPDLGPSPSSALARNIILYGPPGTGKTHVAKLVARALTGDDDGGSDGRFRLVQFHPSYSYEDFIQGLKPDLKKTELRYALERGPFLKIVDDAQLDPSNFYVLIVDEINRGDPARIFGELLYALEYRDEPVMLPLGGELSVPSNLVVIGTMNSVDRSVALVDYALRRRFGFVRVDPDGDVIERAHGDTVLGSVGSIVLERMNAWLTKRLDREHVLGHSFFLNPALSADDETSFARIWSLDVRPLLEEYFFGDGEGLQEAEGQWRLAVSAAMSALDEVATTEDGDDERERTKSTSST